MIKKIPKLQPTAPRKREMMCNSEHPTIRKSRSNSTSHCCASQQKLHNHSNLFPFGDNET
uniref:Uncharacterized protein n=1 Tax=Arundo donax TaxID=35708 RepID=A0A0A8YG96_ARUDO